MLTKIEELLGNEAEELLNYQAKGVPKTNLHLPGPDFVDCIFTQTDRPIRVLSNLQRVYNHGRLAGTGYVSILPVDQGIDIDLKGGGFAVAFPTGQNDVQVIGQTHTLARLGHRLLLHDEEFTLGSYSADGFSIISHP